MSLTHTNTNAKWIKNLNIRPDNLKKLQEVVQNTLRHIGISNDFLKNKWE
jgi:hypothetical protein